MGTPTRSFTREQRMTIISGMLAFVLIIVVLFAFGRRSYLPAALALPYDREQR